MTPRPLLVVALATLAALVLALAPPAAAQQGNPAGMTPASRAPAPSPAPNPADRLFVLLVGQGGLAEVELGRLAQARGGSDAVKRLGQRMVEDHGRANAELAQAARTAGLAPPTEPAPEQRATRERLAGLQGAAFDQAYLRAQLVEHQKAVQLLQWEMGSGQHAPLQQMASATLPTVLEHLAHVRQLLEDPPEPR